MSFSEGMVLKKVVVSLAWKVFHHQMAATVVELRWQLLPLETQVLQLPKAVLPGLWELDQEGMGSMIQLMWYQLVVEVVVVLMTTIVPVQVVVDFVKSEHRLMQGKPSIPCLPANQIHAVVHPRV
jgi:hypothetical protein